MICSGVFLSWSMALTSAPHWINNFAVAEQGNLQKNVYYVRTWQRGRLQLIINLKSWMQLTCSIQFKWNWWIYWFKFSLWNQVSRIHPGVIIIILLFICGFLCHMESAFPFFIIILPILGFLYHTSFLSESLSLYSISCSVFIILQNLSILQKLFHLQTV